MFEIIQLSERAIRAADSAIAGTDPHGMIDSKTDMTVAAKILTLIRNGLLEDTPTLAPAHAFLDDIYERAGEKPRDRTVVESPPAISDSASGVAATDIFSGEPIDIAPAAAKSDDTPEMTSTIEPAEPEIVEPAPAPEKTTGASGWRRWLTRE